MRCLQVSSGFDELWWSVISLCIFDKIEKLFASNFAQFASAALSHSEGQRECAGSAPSLNFIWCTPFCFSWQTWTAAHRPQAATSSLLLPAPSRPLNQFCICPSMNCALPLTTWYWIEKGQNRRSRKLNEYVEWRQWNVSPIIQPRKLYKLQQDAAQTPARFIIVIDVKVLN